MNPSDLVVRDVMQKKFVSFQPDTDIYGAIKVLLSKGLMGAPVVEGKKLVGVFSEKDAFTVLANWTFQVSQQTGGTVQYFMTTDLVTVEADAKLSILVGQFAHSYFRGLPVVEEGNLVGLVSRRDIIKAMMSIQDAERTVNYPDSKYGSNIPGLE